MSNYTMGYLEAIDAWMKRALKAEAERDELLKALQLLWIEVVASGNSKATDYGWPKACAAASKALSPHAAGECKEP